MIYPIAFALALLLTEATRALPQIGNPSTTPASSTGSTYSSTASPSSSPYSTTSNGCPCYSAPTPYPPTDKNGTTYSSGSYPTSSTSSSCSCSSSTTPYPSSSSYTSSKEPYPPTTKTPPYMPPPYKPSGNCSTSEPPKAPSTTLRATYDTTYDNKDGSLNSVACSNGANGLVGRFPTFGDIPSFPFIGGAFDVVWNSPNCGGCWTLTNAATGVSINLTAVDATGSGFNIAQEAFVKLNGGQVGQGVVDVVATKVSPSVCGL